MNKTHQSITSGLTKMIKDLENLKKANETKMKINTAEIKRLKAKCIELENESSKCIVTAQKLKEIIGA
jgi:hypothetical protein